MGLGDLIREVKRVREHGAFLLPVLAKQLYERREHVLQEDMWFSPSEISHMCPRAYAISWKLGLPLVDEFMPDNKWYMDFGSAIHMLMQDVWGGNGGWLMGGWRCTECGYKHGIDPGDKVCAVSHKTEEPDKVTIKSAIRKPGKCEKCGMEPGWRRDLSYIEPMFYDLELRVCGWCDGILVLPGQPAELVDFKTTANARWVREQPNQDHVKQLSWYLDMAGMTRGRIVYVDRTAKKLRDAIIEHQFFINKEMMGQQKEMIRGLRKVFQSKEGESSIPACPNGGYGAFGPCSCSGIEHLWESYGVRSGIKRNGGGNSL